MAVNVCKQKKGLDITLWANQWNLCILERSREDAVINDAIKEKHIP